MPRKSVIAPAIAALIRNQDCGQAIHSSGVSAVPDFVAGIRWTWVSRWHLKTAVVPHPVRAQSLQPITGSEAHAGTD